MVTTLDINFARLFNTVRRKFGHLGPKLVKRIAPSEFVRSKLAKHVKLPLSIQEGIPISNLINKLNGKQFLTEFVGYKDHIFYRDTLTSYNYNQYTPNLSGVSKFSSDYFQNFQVTGVPSLLFTNWNLASNRDRGCLSGIYFSNSIRYSGEAVKALRNNIKRITTVVNSSLKLSNFECELFDTMNSQRINTINTGTYIEFKMPLIETILPNNNVKFLNKSVINEWRELITMLSGISGSIEKVFFNYGSLPVTESTTYKRVHFPNLTVTETELLISDLGIINGLIYPDYQETDILSPFTSMEDLMTTEFSPVLSEF